MRSGGTNSIHPQGERAELAALYLKRPEAVSGPMVREGEGGLLVQLVLPAPPSANALFRNTKNGRVRTKLYEDWLGHAGWRLKAQRPPSLIGPVLILLGVERTNNLADIDNRI